MTGIDVPEASMLHCYGSGDPTALENQVGKLIKASLRSFCFLLDTSGRLGKPVRALHMSYT